MAGKQRIYPGFPFAVYVCETDTKQRIYSGVYVCETVGTAVRKFLLALLGVG